MNIEPLEARIAPASFIVTSLADLPVGGETSLREAVDLANLDPATADTITFKPGLTGTIALLSTIQVVGPVAIKGPGIDKLTVDASGTTRAFFIQNNPASESTVSLSNLGIVGGSGGTNGGAIVCFEPLSLTKVGITGGQANDSGGGLWVETTGKVNISGSFFSNNEATNGAGGGLYVVADAGVTVSKTVIAFNDAPNASGGGAFLGSLGTKGFVTVSDSRFSKNSGGDGAGLYAELTGTRPAMVKNSTFSDNISATSGGGLALNNCFATVSGSLVSGNSAPLGGGLVSGPLGTATITKTVFAGNEATEGGAVYRSASGTLKIAGSQFFGNSSTGTGGALGLIDASVAISSSLFSGNTSDLDGGAISQRNGSLVIQGTSFIANRSITSAGGAILADADVTVSGGKFLHNTAGSNGGAIFTKRSSAASAGALAVTGTLFQGNADDSGGGALFFFDDSTATIKGAKFIENFSKSPGGAISSATTGTIDVSGSLFRGNVAGSSGGAVRIQLGDARFVSCSFYENTGSMALGDGGAISIKLAAGTVTLSKLKVIGNSAGIGGGISNFGPATTLTASTVTGNFANTDPNTSGI